jgi:periplasmic divalent cation tolerance protein
MSARSPQVRDAVLCLITTPQGSAHSIAATVVERGLAACVNVVPAVHSVYRWRGAVEHDEESLLVVKTTRTAVALLDELLVEIHPYESFELIATEIVAGSVPYLEWLASSVAPE